MGQVKSGASMTGRVILELTEEEARALKAITSYGHAPFIKWFYEKLGKVYIHSHIEGIESLFDTIGKEIPKHLKRFDDARLVFNKKIDT